jgi:hypothetical protein
MLSIHVFRKGTNYGDINQIIFMGKNPYFICLWKNICFTQIIKKNRQDFLFSWRFLERNEYAMDW